MMNRTRQGRTHSLTHTVFDQSIDPCSSYHNRRKRKLTPHQRGHYCTKGFNQNKNRLIVCLFSRFLTWKLQRRNKWKIENDNKVVLVKHLLMTSHYYYVSRISFVLWNICVDNNRVLMVRFFVLKYSSFIELFQVWKICNIVPFVLMVIIIQLLILTSFNESLDDLAIFS